MCEQPWCQCSTRGGGKMRVSETGATRDTKRDKPEYSKYISPLFKEAFGEYMRRHQDTALGHRPGDNWQRGLDQFEALDSAERHLHTVAKHMEGIPVRDNEEDDLIDAACAAVFNLQVIIYEELTRRLGLKRKPERLGDKCRR